MLLAPPDCADSRSKKAIIEQIVKARLKLPPPQNHKAVLIAQMFCPSTLSLCLNDLKTLAESNFGLYSAIAAELHSIGLKHQEDMNEKDELEKSNVWRGLYGRTCGTGWLPPLKEEPGWGYWAVYPISPAQWWIPPCDEEK